MHHHKHIHDNKLYYANECGFFAGLGFTLIQQEKFKLEYTPEAYAFATFTQENIFWYYKMAAHYGLLALKELEIEEDKEINEYLKQIESDPDID
jgi:hypothetical protein